MALAGRRSRAAPMPPAARTSSNDLARMCRKGSHASGSGLEWSVSRPIKWSCSSVPVSRTAWSGFGRRRTVHQKVVGHDAKGDRPLRGHARAASTSRASDRRMAGCVGGYSVTPRAPRPCTRARSRSASRRVPDRAAELPFPVCSLVSLQSSVFSLQFSVCSLQFSEVSSQTQVRIPRKTEN